MVIITRLTGVGVHIASTVRDTLSPGPMEPVARLLYDDARPSSAAADSRRQRLRAVRAPRRRVARRNPRALRRARHASQGFVRGASSSLKREVNLSLAWQRKLYLLHRPFELQDHLGAPGGRRWRRAALRLASEAARAGQPDPRLVAALAAHIARVNGVRAFTSQSDRAFLITRRLSH